MNSGVGVAWGFPGIKSQGHSVSKFGTKFGTGKTHWGLTGGHKKHESALLFVFVDRCARGLVLVVR